MSIEYGGRRFFWEGYVDRAEAALEELSRTIAVVVRVPDPFSQGQAVEGGGDSETGAAPPLLVGQFARVAIDGLELAEYFILPRRALRLRDEVWAIGAGRRVQIVPVAVLQETDEQIFVLGDFTAGQFVIVAGITVATNGMEVRVNDAGRR